MYSIPCRILCWILIYSQLGGCKKQTIDAPPPTHLIPTQNAVEDTSFCKADAPAPVALALTGVKTQPVSHNGFYTVQISLTSDYQESFFSWNLCPENTPLPKGFNHFQNKTFSSRCQLATNQETSAHFFETDVFPEGRSFLYIASCDAQGNCPTWQVQAVGHRPGSNPDLQAAWTKYHGLVGNLQTAVDAFRTSLQGLVQGGQLTVSQQALVNKILLMPRATLMEILQTDDFQTFYAQYAALPPQSLQLSTEDKQTLSTTCNLDQVMQPDATDTNLETDTGTASAVATDVAAVAPAGGGGGLGPLDILGYIGTVVGILSAVVGVIYAGYNVRLATQTWRMNEDTWKKVEAFVKESDVYRPEEAKRFWETEITEKQLSPKLQEIQREMISPAKGEFAAVERLNPAKIKELQVEESASFAKETKGYKWRAAGGFLAFAVMGTLAILSAVHTFSLASDTPSIARLETQAKAMQQAAHQVNQVRP